MRAFLIHRVLLQNVPKRPLEVYCATAGRRVSVSSPQLLNSTMPNERPTRNPQNAHLKKANVPFYVGGLGAEAEC